MSRMLAYVDDRIIKSVAISLHFDDNSIRRTTVSVDDEVAFIYLYKKCLIEIQGKIRDIFVNRFNQTTLKLDISSKYKSGIIYLVTDNIRDFLEIKPGQDPYENILGNENTTFEDVVDDLTHQG